MSFPWRAYVALTSVPRACSCFAARSEDQGLRAAQQEQDRAPRSGARLLGDGDVTCTVPRPRFPGQGPRLAATITAQHGVQIGRGRLAACQRQMPRPAAQRDWLQVSSVQPEAARWSPHLARRADSRAWGARAEARPHGTARNRHRLSLVCCLPGDPCTAAQGAEDGARCAARGQGHRRSAQQALQDVSARQIAIARAGVARRRPDQDTGARLSTGLGI